MEDTRASCSSSMHFMAAKVVASIAAWVGLVAIMLVDRAAIKIANTAAMASKALAAAIMAIISSAADGVATMDTNRPYKDHKSLVVVTPV